MKQVSVFRAGSEPPLIAEERLTDEEACRIGAYLEAGAVVMHTNTLGTDVLDGDAKVVPLTIRTDGEFVWTGPVTYYVKKYGVAPDADFLAHVRACDYRVRVTTELEIAAAAAVFAPAR
ncbi:hypothetical protein GCM10009775_12100 [Microbacterium aoyamense]|uniref:Uncharacterized protein n=1 Tax=Microbacterium aoyamense TaxID=344166 RepID=A0ABN2PGH7_9MICO|nr:hypothetical protein [Microbacterium aoyamense]